jgi:glycine oxidase
VTRVTGRHWGDVVVVGGGLVGLASALAMADRGIQILLVDDDRPGQASRASGGVLAPSIHPAPGAAGSAAYAALARYPAFLDALHERTGRRVVLGRGVLYVAASDGDAERLRGVLAARRGADARWRAAAPFVLPGGERVEPPPITRVQQLRPTRRDAGARWLDAASVRALEPALRAAHGAVLHPEDGWVDASALLDALREAVAGTRRIRVLRGTATELHSRRPVTRLTLADGSRAAGRRVVVANGAWSSLLGGRHRAIRVRPLRGQMIEVLAAACRHAVFGAGGYLVPSAHGTLVGATSEAAGFDAATTAVAADELRAVLAALAPDAADAPISRHWAGIRPMTADGQPLLGQDPERPGIVYACGHSRNGVLLAALTGDCVAALVTGTEPPVDLRPFAPDRFDALGSSTS